MKIHWLNTVLNTYSWSIIIKWNDLCANKKNPYKKCIDDEIFDDRKEHEDND